MRTLFVGILLSISFTSFSQTTPGIETKRFYDALNKGDSAQVSFMLADDAIITHYEEDTIYSFDKEGFMGVCPKFKSGLFREDFVIEHEMGYPGMSIIEVSFDFYLDGKYHHCGKDIVYMNDKMQITAVHSTENSCKGENGLTARQEQINWMTTYLNGLMDDWHQAASDANYDDYFGFMADDFYYLGTDPSERWSKEQFSNFSKPYFDKGKAWSFTAIERNFYFSHDFSVIWFDERLETWMEECRGSGVIILENMTNGEAGTGEAKLYHYNLTVTIENEKMDDFIKLRQK